MDVITHLALGTCITEILLPERIGKKRLLWGAFAQVLPDIDTLPALWLSADRALLVHRGLTHSFLFALTMGALLALLIPRIYRPTGLSYAALLFFFCFQLILHDLIDTCNSYGTGLLEPFSHHRFSVNLLYVADPLFTVGLIIGSIVLIYKSAIYPVRKRWAWAMIVISLGYVGYTGINKAIITHKATLSFQSQHINPISYLITPAPFNCMLWYIVAATNSAYYTGYSSVWDDRRIAIYYEKQPKNNTLINHAGDKKTLQRLTTFAEGYYTISQTGHYLYFNVLRFGQIQGWRMAGAPFVLRYPLTASGNKTVILQQGRLAGWDKTAFKAYLRRIAGHQP